MIIMYHHIAPQSAVPTAPTPDWAWTHSPEDLRGQIRGLRKRGYKIVSLAQMVESLKTAGKIPKRWAALTFDDGWKDNHTYALPVLQAEDAPATYFLTTAHLTGETDPTKMTVDEIRDCVKSGISMGSHTVNHPNLASLSGKALEDEIQGSKTAVEAVTDQPALHFAYPGGRFSKAAIETIQSAGFEAAVCSIGLGVSKADDLFTLKRDVLTGEMTTLRDKLALSPTARMLLNWRGEKRKQALLQAGTA